MAARWNKLNPEQSIAGDYSHVLSWPTLVNYRHKFADDLDTDIFAFTRPDIISAIDENCLKDCGLKAPDFTLYGANPAGQTIDFSLTVLKFDTNSFFVRAYLPVSEDSSFLIWVKIPPYIATDLLMQNLPECMVYGLLANSVTVDGESYLLHGLVELSFSAIQKAPTIIGITDTFSPFKTLPEVISYQQLSKENSICLAQDYFNNALREQRSNNLFAAKKLYHQAYLYGHPYGLLKELECQSALGKEFRDKHPETFGQITRGDKLMALTTLRAVSQNYPPHGDAVLAYILRSAKEPAEGLAAAERSLAVDPEQADVLGHKCLFEIELSRDEAAYETALKHLLTYPLDSVATANLLDSCLLLTEFSSALVLAERYALLAPNIEATLNYYFRVYELVDDWERLLDIFQAILPHVSGPTPKILCLYGDVLVENKKLDEAIKAFEHALIINPADGEVILGYARALARIDRGEEAENLLRSVINDQDRFDQVKNKAFIITLLAEILRRNERAGEAVELLEKNFNDFVALATAVGPLPALEYVESLLILGRKSSAKRILTEIKMRFTNDPYVNELYNIAHQ
ncbi:MAG: tetratricopeptide repeat protein [Deltaproteobacteria bacterium]|nr:tetratricopeptide repeat protein [Deltaproteobacteria bacterium]